MSEISVVLVGEVNMLPDPRKHHAVSLVKVVFFFIWRVQSPSCWALLAVVRDGPGSCVRCWDSVQVIDVVLWNEGVTRAPGSV
jgi:hypothetical protein